jgi:hypothetical protein
MTRQELGKASRVLGRRRLRNFIRKYDGLFRWVTGRTRVLVGSKEGQERSCKEVKFHHLSI